MIGAGLVASTLGTLVAFALSMLRGRSRGLLFRTGVMAVAVLPFVLHATGWENLFGKFSIAWGTRPEPWFDGAVAAIWVHGVQGSSLVALLTHWAIHRLDADLVDTARLDHGPIAAWWKVELLAARNGWFIGCLFVILLAATEMTVADLYLYPTLADRFYLYFAANPDFINVVVTLLPALGLFAMGFAWASLRGRRRSGSNLIGGIHLIPSFQGHIGAGGGIARSPAPPRIAGMATVIMSAYLGFAALVPLSALWVKLARNPSLEVDGQLAFGRLFYAISIHREEFYWTGVISLAATMVVVPLAWLFGEVIFRDARGRKSVVIWLALWFLFCLPGPIVGLAIVSFFRLPLPGFDFLYSQTIVPTVVALLPRCLPPAVLIFATCLSALPAELHQMLRLEPRIIRRLWLRVTLSWRHAILVASVVMVLASGDLAATLPVIPPGISTVATRLFGLLHSGARYQEAALALWYVALLVFPMLVIGYLSRKRPRHPST